MQRWKIVLLIVLSMLIVNIATADTEDAGTQRLNVNQMDNQVSDKNMDQGRHGDHGTQHISGETVQSNPGDQVPVESRQQHTQHHKNTDTDKINPAKLDIVPVSGIAREGGYDNSFMMESTSAGNSLQTRCAQASRGIIMLDNATWEQCGGKPKGVPGGEIKDEQGTSGHGSHMHESQ